MSRSVRVVICFLLVSCVTLTAKHLVSAASFKDVTNYKEEIEFLTESGIIRGYPDGTYKPAKTISRVQAVIMIMRDLGIPEGLTPPDPNFKDMKPGDTGYLEVARAVQLGIISGSDYHIFAPQGELTRAQMTKILTKAYGFSGLYPKTFSDVPTDSWAVPYINSMAAVNVTIGYPDGTFKPNLAISRAHFAVFMSRILNPSFKPKSANVARIDIELLKEDIQVVDAIKHPSEPILYFINGNNKTLVSMNYDTFEKVSTVLPYPAEKLSFSNGQIYVTQVKHPHNHYTLERDQEGAFGVYNAKSLELIKLHHIKIDPFDMEVDHQGIVYISGGSGQWTRIESYNGETGQILSSQSDIRQKSDIQLNPKQNKIYTIPYDEEPRVSAYPIINGLLQSEIRSSYTDSSHTAGEKHFLGVSPDGRYIFINSGLVMQTNEADANEDMVVKDSLYYPFTASSYNLLSNEMYFGDGSRVIQAYNSTSLKKTYQLATYGQIQHLFYDSKKNMLLILSDVKVAGSQEVNIGVEKIYFHAQ